MNEPLLPARCRYDGQVFVKPPEVLARDRLLGTYEVKPVLARLRCAEAWLELDAVQSVDWRCLRHSHPTAATREVQLSLGLCLPACLPGCLGVLQDDAAGGWPGADGHGSCPHSADQLAA